MKKIMRALSLMLFSLIILWSCSQSSVDNNPLPNSLKGLELYGWIDNKDMFFTLISGTNRVKTKEDVVSDENSIEEQWVRVKVKGIEELKKLLNRVPEATNIFWHSNSLTDHEPVSSKIIEEIAQFCKQKKLKFE